MARKQEMTITMESSSGLIPAEALAQTISGTVEALTAIERNMTGNSPEMVWVVKRMGKRRDGVLYVTIAAAVRVKEEEEPPHGDD